MAGLEPAVQPDLAPSARAALFTLTLFCLTHFIIDVYSGALGALQPLLMGPFRMNFTEAGILAGVLGLSIAAVYRARSRVLARLKALVQLAQEP